MNHFNRPISRRRFLATGAAALGVAPLAFLPARAGSPNDEILIGIIGCGAMGMGNMVGFLHIEGVRVVAVCDADSDRMAQAKATVDGHYQNSDCTEYSRYEDLLGHPGLNAISLATPDHSHAVIGIAAANTGLDIYGEKPFTWGLAEGRALMNAITRNKRVWQTGSWQRSRGGFQRFHALIQNGTLGKLTRFECGTPAGMGINENLPQEEWSGKIGRPPPNLDWDAWCAPVKDYQYHPMIHPWNWRWLNEFGGGQLLDWVGHHVDIALWALDLEDTGPVKIEGTGQLGDHELFDTYVDYAYQGTFENGVVIEVRTDIGGTRFTGENGWIHVNRGSLEASDRELLRNVPDDFEARIPSHQQNFIDCMRSRKRPISHAEASHRAASFGQLGIVAIDTGEPLHWDPEKEEVIGNAAQSAHPRLGGRI